MPTPTEVWSRLAEDLRLNDGGAFGLALVESSHDVACFLTVSRSDNSKGLLVALPTKSDRKALRPFTTTALQATTGTFPGLPPDHTGHMLQLRDESYGDLFALLCGDIIGSIGAAHSQREALDSLARVIARWRRFLENRNNRLTAEEVRGLIGELLVLSRLAHTQGPDAALEAWASPAGSLRDFELAGHSLEVKTFMAAAGGEIRISDPGQLEDLPTRPLVLAVIQLASVVGGRSLPDIVTHMRGHVFAPAGLSERFDDALAASGYMVAHADQYDTGYTIRRPRTYLVGLGFPRISPASVPAGVTHVQFSIPVAALQPFACEAEQLLGSVPSPYEIVE